LWSVSDWERRQYERLSADSNSDTPFKECHHKRSQAHIRERLTNCIIRWSWEQDLAVLFSFLQGRCFHIARSCNNFAFFVATRFKVIKVINWL
jgi:hypothetical protein